MIVTSRNPTFRRIAQPLVVKVMEPGEAADFLLKRAPGGERNDAEALATELGFLPLALEQAGAYIEEHGSTFGRYLELFRTRRTEILRRGSQSKDVTVATTWELSFVEAEKKSEAAGQLMNLCAFLAPDDIGREMLRSGAKHLPEPLAKAVADDLLWDEAVGALRGYSLLEVKSEAISVHRLVQAVARDRMDEAARRMWAEAAVEVVNTAFPYKSNDVRTWTLCSRLLPHSRVAEAHATELGVGTKACVRLMNHVGNYLRGRAELLPAKEVLTRALKMAEAAYGTEDPNVAVIVNNHGLVLREMGDLAGARTQYERALKIGEAAYGPDHPNVAIQVNNLGMVLQDLGDLAGARTHIERALKIDEAADGPDHLNVARDVSNLGCVFKELGDLAGARTHSERALKIDEAAYGSDHPNVANRLNNLGSVLQDMGDLAGARVQIERALKIFEKSLGKDHPNTKLVRKNLESLG